MFDCGKKGHHNQATSPEKSGGKHEEKKKVENVFVMSEVSERSPNNIKHGKLNMPVNYTSVTLQGRRNRSVWSGHGLTTFGTSKSHNQKL